MPQLTDTTRQDMSGYTPVDKPEPVASLPVSSTQQSTLMYTRCPLPLLSNSTPDDLRTYDKGSIVPQNRILNPPPVQAASITTNPTTVIQKTVTNNNNITTNNVTGSISSLPAWVEVPLASGGTWVRQWLTVTPGDGALHTVSLPKDISVVLGISATCTNGGGGGALFDSAGAFATPGVGSTVTYQSSNSSLTISICVDGKLL